MESRHGQLLKSKLTARRQELLEAMARGLALDEYQRLVGQAQALDDAVKMSDDADYELSGGQ